MVDRIISTFNFNTCEILLMNITKKYFDCQILYQRSIINVHKSYTEYSWFSDIKALIESPQEVHTALFLSSMGARN